MTGWTVASVVNIVNGMTAVAGSGRLCKAVAAVAVHALDGAMGAGQAIVGVRVIEAGLCPDTLHVTTLAGISQRTAMDIVVRVARATARRGVPIRFVRCMTVTAGRAQVGPQQREVCVIVIEDAGIDRHDVGVPAFVIRVADNTFVAQGGIEFTVESGFCFPVVADVIMAFNTQSRMRQVRLHIVAGVAFALDFCMALDYPARHYQFFNAGGARNPAAEQRMNRQQ